MIKPMNLKNSFFWLVAIISLIFDQLTKSWVVQNFQLDDTMPVWSGVFHFTFVRNTGAAFSLFTQSTGWLRWLSLIVSIGLMVLAAFGPYMNKWDQLGYGFILGGALGNGIDRFFRGYVIDFLDLRLIHFPVFNIADISINLGLLCLAIAYFHQDLPPGRRRVRDSFHP